MGLGTRNLVLLGYKLPETCCRESSAWCVPPLQQTRVGISHLFSFPTSVKQRLARRLTAKSQEHNCTDLGFFRKLWRSSITLRQASGVGSRGTSTKRLEAKEGRN